MITPRMIFLAVCGLVIAAFAYGLYHAGQEKAALQGQLVAARQQIALVTAAREQAEENLRQINTANARNAMRFADDQLVLERLERLVDETPQNSDRCLDADAARRMRDVR